MPVTASSEKRRVGCFWCLFLNSWSTAYVLLRVVAWKVFWGFPGFGDTLIRIRNSVRHTVLREPIRESRQEEASASLTLRLCCSVPSDQHHPGARVHGCACAVCRLFFRGWS